MTSTENRNQQKAKKERGSKMAQQITLIFVIVVLVVVAFICFREVYRACKKAGATSTWYKFLFWIIVATTFGLVATGLLMLANIGSGLLILSFALVG